MEQFCGPGFDVLHRGRLAACDDAEQAVQAGGGVHGGHRIGPVEVSWAICRNGPDN
ncbi:hypothetical protein GCM10017600_39020 [Streptosporangium carneum]|uniref:Uncharacterized protein n=1 Tax=Streptosporangium carneum TaxID=47481 RepID=A0A9W6MDT7_9ACTN|nr:hypothetical protein GCM10017600_39020 [Streptosporangium carneum]